MKRAAPIGGASVYLMPRKGNALAVPESPLPVG